MPSPRLPTELRDLVVDFLCDSRDALKSCSLVSKSWIPCSRKYLFADIEVNAMNLPSWKSTFPDPSASPACHTRKLLVEFPLEIVDTDAEEGGWISAFSRVVDFKVDAQYTDTDWPEIYLAPFNRMSPMIKSLKLSFCGILSSQVYDLIYSFPLLEDLAVISYDRWITNDYGQPTASRPSISPALTGCLDLCLETKTDLVASWLLSLPGGLRFRELRLAVYEEEDMLPAIALVEGCRFTLESLEVSRLSDEEFELGFIDLSKAIRLKETTFACSFDPRWVIMALRSVTCNHRNLQRVSVIADWLLYRRGFCRFDPANIVNWVGETVYLRWLELDRLLYRLWESHSVHLEVRYEIPPSMDEKRARGFMEKIFPELTSRGLVDLVGRKC